MKSRAPKLVIMENNGWREREGEKLIGVLSHHHHASWVKLKIGLFWVLF